MKIRKTGDLRNRVLSFMSAAIISVSTMPVVPYSTAEAVKSANVKSSVNFPEVGVNPEDSAKLNHDDTLVDNGDGTYTFTSKITADYSFSDISESRLKSTDGVYPLDKAGTYLIELWGGDGGDGGEFFPLSFLGGAGGSGGFVYGTLTVSQADVGKKKLVYEIGSKGESETRSITGGGTNGTGGGAGDIAIFSVGAGGGHSAVYLVKSEHDDTLTDIEKNDPSKVLMIAGGGGGGGAGASLHSLNFLSTIFGGEGKANGGDGGYNYNGVLSDTPSIGNFDKNSNYVGKYYAGKNGSTSGTKGAYAGQGGTDKPGEVVKTFIGILENDNYANDWQQIYHPELARGVGGAGNFRGGGGGAGFAGATGGFQNEPIDGRNVGGGGGGSSYIAAGGSEGGFTGFTPNDMPTGDQAKYFVDRTGNDNKAVGGAVVIRYMPTGADYRYLEDVTVSATVSSDFEIVSQKCENVKYNETSKKFDSPVEKHDNDNDTTNNNISFTGSVAPVGSGIRQGQEQNYLTITLKLKPKNTFMGGNDVPIFTYDANNMAFDCTSSAATGSKTCKFIESGTVSGDFSVSHVNVPFCYNIEANSFNVNKDTVYGANDIIKAYDTYDTAGNTYTDSISPPYVTVAGETAHKDSFSADYGAKGIYNYDAAIDVSAKTDGANSVGEANPKTPDYKTLRARSVVEVIDGEQLDGFTVKARKSLEYNTTDDTYDFTVDLDIESQNVLNRSFYVYDPIASTYNDYTYNTATSADNTYPVTLTEGYYYIEAYGGDGGHGGNSFLGMHTGGEGGKGGHVSGFLEVSAGENKVLSVTVGRAGNAGAGFGLFSNWSSDFGEGGLSTIIKLGTQDILIAGGGGGGGEAYRNVLSTYDGANGYDAGENGATGVKSDSDSNKHDGANGNKGTPALGGQNLKDSGAFIGIEDIPDYFDKTYTAFSDPGNYGAVRITKLGVKGGYGNSEGTETSTIATEDDVSSWETAHTAYYATLRGYVKDFTLTEDFSEYFDFNVNDDIVVTSNDATVGNPPTRVGQSITFDIDLNDSTVHDSEANVNNAYTPISGYTSITTQRRDYSYSVNGSCKITVKLKPKPNLVGGNDIPLLAVDKVSDIDNDETYMAEDITEVSLSHNDAYTGEPVDDPNTIYLKRNNATDWANVAIKEECLTVDAAPMIVDYGETPDLSGAVTFAEQNSQSENWEYGFVHKERETAPSGAVTKDCKRTVLGTLRPDEAVKAITISPVSAVTKTDEADIKVRYKVTKSLTNILQDGDAKYISGEATPVVIDTSNLNEASLISGNGGVDKFILDKIGDAYVLNLEAADEYDLPGSDPDHPIEDHVHVYYDDGDDETVDAEVTSADIAKKDGYITITIPASAFTQNLRIEAEGVPQTPHYVHYMYAFYDKTAQRVLTKESVQQESGHDKVYHSGDTIVESYPFMPDYSTDPTEFPTGYDNYDWDWPIEKDNSGNYVMGDTDIYVVGTYRPVTYKIRITYESDNAPDTDFDTAIGGVGNKEYTSPDRTEYHDDTNTFDIALTAGTEFYRKSPEVSGYYPDRPVIAFTVDDDFINNIESGTNPLAAIADSQIISGGIDGHKAVEVPVKYTKLAAGENLIINFVECDIKGNPTGNSSSSAFVIDGAYDEHTTAIENAVNAVLGSENEIYLRTKLVEDSETHIKKETVFDEVKGNSSEGLTTFNVYYRPKLQTVTVKFYDKLGDTETVATKTCVIGREYGYNADTQIYDSMPRAVRSNERLIGWQTEDGEWVTEESMVEGADGDIIKLYGVWEPLDNIINVDYKYAYSIDTNVADPKTPGADIPDTEFDDPPIRSTIVKYGMSYTIPVPTTLTESSYKADKTAVSGVAFGTKTEEVLYSNNSNTTPSVTLTVNIYSNMYEGGTIDNSTPKLTGGTFELWDTEGNRVGPAKKNTDGSVSWTDLDSGITASGDYIIKCIDPPAGFGTAEMPVILNNADPGDPGKYSTNMFLDKFPFPLPFAGGKPLTGYTVGGLSTMLLAAFLLFLYVSSKSEEEKENE